MLEGEIPALLKLLYDRLQSGSFEEWHSQVLLKLLISTDRNCRELLKSLSSDWVSQTAWIARNLLELWIWTNFCAASPQNTRRFYEDALRDVNGLSESLSQIGAAVGAMEAQMARSAAKARIREVASEKLGLADLDMKYCLVADAAKTVGLEELFFPQNRFLSKFAHPTAGLVIGLSHQEEACRGFQASCATAGVFFARNTLAVFDEQILASR